MARKKKGLTPRQRAARKAARTRQANKLAEEHAQRFFERIIKRQERKARRPAAAPARRRRHRPAAVETPAGPAAEGAGHRVWEMTATYKSGVDTSVRVARVDGRAVSRDEAEEALGTFIGTQRVPSGYTVQSVVWRAHDKEYEYTKGLNAEVRHAVAVGTNWGGDWRIDAVDDSL